MSPKTAGFYTAAPGKFVRVYAYPLRKTVPENSAGLWLLLPYFCHHSHRVITRSTLSIGIHISVVFSNDQQVSWTCHEHAGAWSRSGSLSTSGQSSTGSPASLPSSTASSIKVSATGPTAGGGGAHNQSINPDKSLGLRSTPSGHDANGEEAAVQLENGSREVAADPSTAGEGDSKTSASNVGKQKKGSGVLAKIKGRFGRSTR